MAKRKVDPVAWGTATTARALKLLFPTGRTALHAGNQRKLRLLACAWARKYPTTEGYRHLAIQVAERYADGLADWDELEAALARFKADPHWQAVSGPVWNSCFYSCHFPVAPYFFLESGGESAHPAIAALVRDLFPDPSAPPVKVPKTWRTATVVAIARGAYDDHAFDRLPVLADALEDAGCDSEPLLTHLRGPGPHVRGCWALDAVLGL